MMYIKQATMLVITGFAVSLSFLCRQIPQLRDCPRIRQCGYTLTTANKRKRCMSDRNNNKNYIRVSNIKT